MSQEKARYRITRLSFIGNQLLDEGAEVEYDGEPGSALEPLNEAAEAAKKKADQKRGGQQDVKPAETTVITDGDEKKPEGGEQDPDALRQQYQELFGERPGNMKLETIKQKIADKRKELGV
ncbi:MULTISPECIES: hypothetical protein [Pseudescherichia]|uniref:hypothetical protein n=1 Tax=Pseudescherichia TaxID=2055880 RepID=UPI00301C31E9